MGQFVCVCHLHHAEGAEREMDAEGEECNTIQGPQSIYFLGAGNL